MNKKCFERENLMKAMQGAMIVLDITLFAIPNYFSIEDLKNTEFGLQGATTEENFVAYGDLIAECSLEKYCDKMNDFDRSGKLLISFVCVDIIILISAILMNLVLTLYLKQIIKNKEKVTGSKKIVLKILAFHVNLQFLHPVIINLGFILWIVITRLTNFSHKIILHEGLVVLIVQSFLSWLSLAFNVWILSSTRRRNMRILKGTTYKNEDLSFSI
jgi:hypothetical protein